MDAGEGVTADGNSLHAHLPHRSPLPFSTCLGRSFPERILAGTIPLPLQLEFLTSRNAHSTPLLSLLVIRSASLGVKTTLPGAPADNDDCRGCCHSTRWSGLWIQFIMIWRNLDHNDMDIMVIMIHVSDATGPDYGSNSLSIGGLANKESNLVARV